MERLCRAWQGLRGTRSEAINGKSSHTHGLFSAAAAAPGAAFTPATRRRRRRVAREKHWHAARKKLNGELKIKLKCRAGSSEPPAQRWCHPRHRASRLRTAGIRRAGARCFLHAGVKTNSCRFSELGARPGVLPGEKAAAVKLHGQPRERSWVFLDRGAVAGPRLSPLPAPVTELGTVQSTGLNIGIYKYRDLHL